MGRHSNQQSHTGQGCFLFFIKDCILLIFLHYIQVWWLFNLKNMYMLNIKVSFFGQSESLICLTKILSFIKKCVKYWFDIIVIIKSHDKFSVRHNTWHLTQGKYMLDFPSNPVLCGTWLISYIYATGYYAPVNKKKILPLVTAWKTLKLLCKWSKQVRESQIPYDFTYMWNPMNKIN